MQGMSGWKEDGVGEEVGARVAGGGRESLFRYGQGLKATWGATRRSACASITSTNTSSPCD